MILVDLTVSTDPRYLAASMFLAQATQETLGICPHDLSQLYFLAAGQVAFRGYGEQLRYFNSFYEDNRVEMRKALPENPPLESTCASIVLIEEGLDKGWVSTVASDEWSISQLYLALLFGLPSTALYGFSEWDGSLEEFLKQPWVGKSEDFFRGWELVNDIGQNTRRVIPNLALSDASLKQSLAEIVCAYSKRNNLSDPFVVKPLDWSWDFGFDGMDEVARDVRRTAALGVNLILDGDGEFFTRSKDVGSLLKPITFATRPVLDRSHPMLEKGLARQFLGISGNTTVDAVLDLITNARSVELLNELLAASARETAGSIGAYIGTIASILSPKPVNLLLETTKFAIRRHRRPRLGR